jgi:hypothetical protein
LSASTTDTTEPVTISVLFNVSCKIKGEKKESVREQEREGSSSSTVTIERGLDMDIVSIRHESQQQKY